jgi:hypothetical protein
MNIMDYMDCLTVLTCILGVFLVLGGIAWLAERREQQ